MEEEQKKLKPKKKMEGGSVSERITLKKLDIKKRNWDRLTEKEKGKILSNFVMNVYDMDMRNKDFLYAVESDLLQGMKPKASATEILEAYRQNKDWGGELFRIAEKGLSKFLRQYSLARKWNDGRRLLYFFYFRKLFLDNLSNQNLFTESFGVTADDYPGLHLRPASPVPLFPSLKHDKAASIVNDLLNILELPVMDAKAVKRALEKELKGYKEKRHKSNKNLRAGQTVHAPTLYIDILQKYPAPNVGTTIQRHYKGEESLKIENAFRQFLHRHKWKITDPSHRKAAIQFLTNHK